LKFEFVAGCNEVPLRPNYTDPPNTEVGEVAEYARRGWQWWKLGNTAPLNKRAQKT
jgi:hypothetical protein